MYTAFNGDPIVEKEIQQLVEKFEIRCSIETGTYKGITTKFLASIKNMAEVHSVEIVKDNYVKVRDDTKNLSNIKIYNNSSDVFLKELLPSLNDKYKYILFYLDAHWYDKWPLLDEITEIGRHYYDRNIIVIDDFQVPGRHYQYDSYKNQSNNLNFVKKHLDTANSNYAYYYNNSTGRHPKGVGKLYVISKQLLDEFKVSEADLFHYENGIPYSNL